MRVRTVDADVADGAVLVFGVGQGVGGRCLLDAISLAAKVSGAVVTLQTKRENLRALQKAGVHAAMGHVATGTAIDSYGGVLKDKGAALVNVALHTGLFVLEALGHHARTGGHFPGWGVAAMGVVAIRALHEAFIDAVLDGHGELSAYICMTRITKVCLLLGEKVLRCGGFVNGVTRGAGDIGGGVRTAADVGPAHLLGVARQAVV